MPLALDPDERIELVLASDQAKPPEKRVTFTFTHLSARKFRELQRLINDAIAAADNEKPEDEDKATGAALLLGLSGLEGGKEIPAFSREQMIAVLTVEERWELVIEWRKALTLGAAEKKASPSPLPSDTAGSVPPAATADVSPSQPSPSPSCFPTVPVQPATADQDGANAPTAAAGARTSSSAVPAA